MLLRGLKEHGAWKSGSLKTHVDYWLTGIYVISRLATGKK